MDKKIPRVKFEINDKDYHSGVKTISLVDEPAIESDFIFFNKEKSTFIELKGEKYKQVVAGLALIPDKDILRYDENENPYFGYFTVESVEVIRDKFHRELRNNTVNTDHNQDGYITAYMTESFIIDSEERLADVKAKGISEATIGSWFVAYKIEDPETFKRVVAGELKGFSVEIFLSKFVKQPTNNLSKQFENAMSNFLERFESLLAEFKKKEETKLEKAKSGDQTIEYGKVGEPVNIIAEDGTSTPATEKEYTLDNGKIITVEAGLLTEIKDAPVEQAKEEPNKDDQKLNAEIESLKTDLAKATEDLKKANDEITKLKKAPLVTPVVKTELKKSKKLSDEEYNKLSNVDKLLYKKGLYEPK